MLCEFLQGAVSRIGKVIIVASIVLGIGSAAHAQVMFNSVRVAAADTVAVARFYQAAFGMQEVNRLEVPGGPEIFVNFGAAVDAAKANRNAPIVIMHRDSDAVKDPIAQVILNVTDMNATVAAIKAAGGSMDGDPRPVPEHRHHHRHRRRSRGQPHRADSAPCPRPLTPRQP